MVTSSQIMTSRMSWTEFSERVASGALELVPVGAHEPDVRDRIYQSSGPVDLSLAHAGLIEAAAMLHLAAESVHLERESEDDFRSFPAYDVYPPDPSSLPCCSTLSSPHAATSQLGRFLVETMSENVARLVIEAFEFPTTAQRGSGSVQL